MSTLEAAAVNGINGAPVSHPTGITLGGSAGGMQLGGAGGAVPARTDMGQTFFGWQTFSGKIISQAGISCMLPVSLSVQSSGTSAAPAFLPLLESSVYGSGLARVGFTNSWSSDFSNWLTFQTSDAAGVSATRLHIDSGGIRPGADAIYAVGAPTARWSTVYAATGAISTSDARLKTGVSPLTAAELDAATKIGREIGTYQFLDSIAAKGDAARVHIGLTVQRAIEIMTECGLDPMRYAFICHDSWEEQWHDIPAVEAQPAIEARPAEYSTQDVTEVVLLDGVETTIEHRRPVLVAEAVAAQAAVEAQPARRELARAAGDRYSFRYDQLALFIGFGQEARTAALEARLAALEAKLG